MTVKDAFFRAKAWLKHQLSAWNTGGEGIHSPYLFYLVRMLIYDQNAYYCWTEIEQRRQCMLRAPKLLSVLDYGSKGQPFPVQRLVSDIARTSLESPQVAQLLFRLVVYLSKDMNQSLHIVELGTNLGITTSYLAMANPNNRVVTFEGSDELLQMAARNWDKLRITNIQPIQGNIDDTLYNHARENIDFAFIDANHRYEPTWRYFDYIVSKAHPKTIIAIDDIHLSPEMEAVWKHIQEDKRVTTTMDFYHVGLVFLDPHYIRRHYRLRLKKWMTD